MCALMSCPFSSFCTTHRLATYEHEQFKPYASHFAPRGDDFRCLPLLVGILPVLDAARGTRGSSWGKSQAKRRREVPNAALVPRLKGAPGRFPWHYVTNRRSKVACFTVD